MIVVAIIAILAAIAVPNFIAYRNEVNSHNYDIYKESYSRARFYIRITHPWFSSFMKELFAAIVIVGVGMLSLLMNPTEAKDRIALTSGTLASAIFYHMTLTSSISSRRLPDLCRPLHDLEIHIYNSFIGHCDRSFPYGINQ